MKRTEERKTEFDLNKTYLERVEIVVIKFIISTKIDDIVFFVKKWISS